MLNAIFYSILDENAFMCGSIYSYDVILRNTFFFFSFFLFFFFFLVDKRKL